jgi:DNA-binding transcriptional ArsR family regulator
MSTALDLTLAALADPTRRRVIELLRERPRPAGELAAAFAMPPPAMSRHLRVLRTRGLVDERRDANDSRLRIYALRREPFTELDAWLAAIDSLWTEPLDAFAAQVAT